MADQQLTGAEKVVVVDTAATADNKKKIIKYVIIALVAVGVFFLVKKFILKK